MHVPPLYKFLIIKYFLPLLCQPLGPYIAQNTHIYFLSSSDHYIYIYVFNVLNSIFFSDSFPHVNQKGTLQVVNNCYVTEIIPEHVLGEDPGFFLHFFRN